MKKFIATSVFLLLSPLTQAANIKGMPINNTKIKGGYAITIENEIREGDSQNFINIYNAFKDKGKNINLVAIDSIGGNEIESAKIAKFMIGKKIVTLTKHNGVCYKDCLLIASAGDLRIIRNSTLFNVTKLSLVEKQYPNLYRELNIPKRVISLMNKLKPGDVGYLMPDMKHEFYNEKRVADFFNTPSYVDGTPIQKNKEHIY